MSNAIVSTMAAVCHYINEQIDMAILKTQPIAAANLLEAWSTGLFGIEKAFTNKLLKALRKLNFPNFTARNKNQPPVIRVSTNVEELKIISGTAALKM